MGDGVRCLLGAYLDEGREVEGLRELVGGAFPVPETPLALRTLGCHIGLTSPVSRH